MKRVLAAWVLLIGLVDLTPVSADQSLARLTVPLARLPKNCRLKIVPMDKKGKPDVIMWPTIRANPWVGNRPVTVAEIRAVVEDSHREDHETPTQFDERKALNVLEGYRALYVTPDGGKVDVAAVRFDDPKFSAVAAMRRLSGQVPNIVFGATAARVTSNRGRIVPIEPCDRAVRDYISSLK